MVNWAEQIGPHTAHLFERILAEKPHPEMGYRMAQTVQMAGMARTDRMAVPADSETSSASWDRCVIFRFTIYNHGPGSETTPRITLLHFAPGVTDGGIPAKHSSWHPLANRQGSFSFHLPPLLLLGERSAGERDAVKWRTSDRLSFDRTALKPTPSKMIYRGTHNIANT